MSLRICSRLLVVVCLGCITGFIFVPVANANTMASAQVFVSGTIVGYPWESGFCGGLACGTVYNVDITNQSSTNADASFGTTAGGSWSTAFASYGWVSTSASSNWGFLNGIAGARAEASFSDTVTIMGSPSTGTLEAVVDVEGWMTDDESVGSASIFLGDVGFYMSGTPGLLSPLSMPYTIGDPVQIGASAESLAPDSNPFDPNTGSGGTGDDYARFLQLRFLDANGNQVNGLKYQTASGADYPFLGATRVPEPSSLLLFGTGLFGATGVLRHKLLS